MPMFVLISRFQQPMDAINRNRAAHNEWVERHYAAGHFLVSGPREPPSGGIIVARAASEEEIQEMLSTDPLQQMGLVAYEVFAFVATDFPKRSQAYDRFAT